MTTTTVTTEAITAETMLRLFPDIDTNDEALSGHDEEQIRLMDEVCIVLDNNDVPIGKASKKICASADSKPAWLPAKANILLCRPPHVQH